MLTPSPGLEHCLLLRMAPLLAGGSLALRLLDWLSLGVIFTLERQQLLRCSTSMVQTLWELTKPPEPQECPQLGLHNGMWTHTPSASATHMEDFHQLHSEWYVGGDVQRPAAAGHQHPGGLCRI